MLRAEDLPGQQEDLPFVAITVIVEGIVGTIEDLLMVELVREILRDMIRRPKRPVDEKTGTLATTTLGDRQRNPG